MAIKVFHVDSSLVTAGPSLEDMDKHLASGWTIIGHSTYTETNHYGESGEFVGDTNYYERWTLHKPDDVSETVKADELVLDTITSIERGETSNSNSPMWRCTTANGERVNIFKHEDESKNNFHLFEKKGWGDVLLALELYNRVDTYPFAIAMKRDGKWWAIVDVMQAPVAVELVPQLPFTSLPGDESLDDVFPLTSAADDKAAAEQLTTYQVKISQMSDAQLQKEHDDNRYYERMYGKQVLTVQDERTFFKYHDQLNATEAELEKRKAKAAADESEGAEHGE